MIAHGVFAYMRAYSEFIYHNTKQISQRLLFEKKDEIEHLPKMKQQNGEVVVDCNQFPGYDLFTKVYVSLRVGKCIIVAIIIKSSLNRFSRHPTSRKSEGIRKRSHMYPALSRPL